MSKQELENLVKIGQLKPEPATCTEFDGMFNSAKKRLADARNESLASESRFDLAYGAAHGLALAALRQKGYRSENRFTVFQALTHTVDGLDPVAVCGIRGKAATDSDGRRPSIPIESDHPIRRRRPPC